jgi:chemotaxis protein methyltransferase CheR
MTPTEFSTFATIVHERSGINLGELKYELLRSRMNKRLRALKIGSYREYHEVLQKDKSGLEIERLVDVVTTNKTEFFREARHYDHLVKILLPAFEASPAGRQGQPLRVWSAACSSGEEPYSIAMVLHEALQGRRAFKILATDISSRMLTKAMRGDYSAERVQGVPLSLRERYFDKVSRDGERAYQASVALRDVVQFSRFNLNDPSLFAFKSRFDAIFCRNVMIYFDRPTQEAVVGRLSAQLAPGGALYTGFSESLIGIRHPLKPEGASVYRCLP